MANLGYKHLQYDQISANDMPFPSKIASEKNTAGILLWVIITMRCFGIIAFQNKNSLWSGMFLKYCTRNTKEWFQALKGVTFLNTPDVSTDPLI